MALSDPAQVLQEEIRRLKEQLRATEARLKLAEGKGVPANGGGQGAPADSNIEIPFSELDIRDQIGGGGNALVFKALWGATPVAVKRWLDPAAAGFQDHSAAKTFAAEFKDELTTMRNLRHPNIVLLLGACVHPPDYCLVMEHVPHSLHYILHESALDWDRKRALQLAGELGRAMRYLHGRTPPVVHRDLKPANLLVDRQWRVKVCDFGLAGERAAKGAGTPAYMAPELLTGSPHSEKVDVYAFGIILWEMVARQVPFDAVCPADIRRNVVELQERPEMPLSCPRALELLIRQCWHQDPAARPSFDKVADQLKDLNSE